MVTVKARISSLGGELAHAAGKRYVAAFGHEGGDNPARRALRAAEEVLGQGLSRRIRVDLAAVAVQTRKDGSKRFMSPLFARADRFPSAAGAAGLSLTSAAAAVLPDAAMVRSGSCRGPRRSAGSRLPTSRAPRRPGRAPTSTPPPRWRAGRMIGRDAVLDLLVESARRAAATRVPTTASVIGEPGQGKSHLFRVLVKRLGETGVAEVLALRAREPALGDADHTLAELLQRALDLPATAPADGGRELLRERLGGVKARPRQHPQRAP